MSSTGLPGSEPAIESGGSPEQTAEEETPRAEEEAWPVVKPDASTADGGETGSGDGSAATPTNSWNGDLVIISSPPSPVAQQPHKTVSASQDNYFSPRPMRSHSAQLSIPEHTELSVSPGPPLSSHSPSNSKGRATLALTPEHAIISEDPEDRPTAHRDHSAASTISTISNASTIRSPDTNVYLPLSTPRRDYTHYPNQSYAALQSQHHPTAFSPHYLRSRSSNPSTFSAYNAHLEVTPPVHDESHSIPEPNSTSSSPGLFTTRSRSDISQAEIDGTYASPYLHHTHRQVPKETHLAEIDFDPISGRKVINQYEVIDELGRGVHGKVKLGRNLETGVHVAIKIVERYSKRKRLGKNNSHEDKIKKEIAILKKARHPNIVGLLEVIDDPMSKKVYIILEHVEMGEVQWRKEGATEICLVEYRRCQREAADIFEDEAACNEDQQILDVAQKHVEKHDRLEWRKMKSQRMKGNDIASWSLEYGDDEDDNTSNGNMSRVSSSTAPLSHAARQLYLDPDYPRPDQTVLHHEDTSSLARQRNASDQQLSNWGDDHDIHSDGGIFPPSRGRTPSVAGSVSSTGYERDLLEQIPENFRYVPLMTLEQARCAFRDTVLGLEYLHWEGVVHRDIKPANLLQAADHHIKISDFGVSYLGKEKNEPYPTGDEASEAEGQDVAEAIELAKTVGTPAFYAPELCLTDCDPDSPTPPVTQQIDIWALGVTLFCLIYGRVPFYDDNTFMLMRIIAEQEAFIPNKRLQAVDPGTGSRPPSHGRSWAAPILDSNRRLPHELNYEDVDDELKDLLKRMLTKDPRKRITLNEVKHHGWLVRDIKDKVRWLEETDPNNYTSGQRIKLSVEDVEVAVVPLTIVERAKSVARKVGDIFGISSRKRAESSATNASDRSNPTSAASSSSTISQDARRQAERRRPSLKPEESIFSALKASKESEHPLSQSVTASPELRGIEESCLGPDSVPNSPMSTIAYSAQGSLRRPAAVRPPGPERVQSTSTTGSIRTIRPGDLGLATGASTLPALPSTPLEMNPPSSLSGIFTGAKQKLLSTVKNTRDRSLGRHGRASPIDRVATGSVDPHAHASLAVSDTNAAGHVNSASYLMEGSTTGGSANSPLSSRAPSISSHYQLEPPSSENGMSRNSSLSSIASHFRSRSRTDAATQPRSGYLPLLGDAASDHVFSPPLPSEVFDNEFAKAKEEQIRKMIQESKDRPSSSAGHKRQTSTASQKPCPPSPDDLIFYRQNLQPARDEGESYFSALEPFSDTSHTPLVSSSSEEQFTGMSQSTSNPSIPSVASANSSVPEEDGMFLAEQAHNVRKLSEDIFLSNDQRAIYSAGSLEQQEDFAYDGDHAVESEDEDEDEDSDDSFVEMTRHKSRTQGLTRSESISNGELALHLQRRSESMKSARSGSNNTMKKVRSRNDSDEEAERTRPSSAI